MSKVGMVLEGGAMRGIYTAGVLDVMLDHNIDIDTIVSVSAGALFGLNYFSKQKGRVIRYNKKYCRDRRYISLLSLLLTGNVVNKNFAYYKVTKQLDKFDNDEFINNNKDYYVTVTNIETGNPEYIKISDPNSQLEELRATSAMPLSSKIIKLNGHKYLDGGISDSIPIHKCKDLGCEKIIVILTQPLDYRKGKLDNKKKKLIDLKFHKYPNLINTMTKRYLNYNMVIEEMIKMEKNNEVFIIRPSIAIDINLIERNSQKLQSVYDMGVKDCNKIIDKLLNYLNS